LYVEIEDYHPTGIRLEEFQDPDILGLKINLKGLYSPVKNENLCIQFLVLPKKQFLYYLMNI